MSHKKLSVLRQCALLGLARSGVYRPPAPAGGRRGGEAPDRCAIHGPLRLAANCIRAEDEPQARAAADAADGHCGPGGRSRARGSPRGGTRCSPTSCAGFRSSGRTRYGRVASPTCRSSGQARGPRAFSISWRSRTGRRGRGWRGACRTRWTRPSAWRDSRRPRRASVRLRQAQPEIFNPDWGSQFTSEAFTGVLERAGVRI